MPHRSLPCSPHLSHAEYTGYEFTASAGWDYNYDPSGSRSSSYSSYPSSDSRHHHGSNPTEALDPYADAYTNPSIYEHDSEAGRSPNSSYVGSRNSCEDGYPRLSGYDSGYDDRSWDWDRNKWRTAQHSESNHSYPHHNRHPRRSRSPLKRTIPQNSKNSIPTVPSPEYLAESQKISTRLPTPSTLRKLLILDLNGTLVYRTPHTRKETRGSKRRNPQNRGHDLSQAHTRDSIASSATSSFIANASTNVNPGDASYSSSFFKATPSDPYADTTAPRPLRTVHPRPYMPSFRAYAFHPVTRAWLDTMVWSSAQPHSVRDMVGKCFPGEGEAEAEDGNTEEKTGLVAVWARDTLGLEEKDYHRKTQTTKDLTKPWAQLPLSNSTEGDEKPQAHSAHTTLLLDDSPLKAHLQPWNHLCIREYDNTLRAGDLWSLGRERALASMDDVGEADAAMEVVESAPEAEVDITKQDPYLDASTTLRAYKKRKRPKKKKATAALLPVASPSEFDVAALGHPVTGEGGAEAYNYPYDPTLLAVIGVLERLKWEGNVAGWMRAGGLCPPGSLDAHEDDMQDRQEAIEEEGDDEDNDVVSPPPSPLPDASSSSPRSRSLPVSGTATGAGTGTLTGEGKRRRLSSPSPAANATTNMSTTGTPRSWNRPSTAKQIPDDATTTAATLNNVGTGNLGDSGQWFADASAFAFWVRAGVKTLLELGIEVEHGVRG